MPLSAFVLKVADEREQGQLRRIAQPAGSALRPQDRPLLRQMIPFASQSTTSVVKRGLLGRFPLNDMLKCYPTLSSL